MKKIILAILLVLPLLANAKNKVDDTKYLNGAVPEVNGHVIFTKGFAIPNRSKQEIHDIIQPWVNGLIENSIPAPGNYAKMMHDSKDTITARICEWMLFKKKPLNLDRTRFRFQMQIFITDGHVTISCNRINYNYGSDELTGAIGEEIPAEGWITDKDAVNKSNTKLYPKSGKFRRKTVDRMEAIFNEAMDLFETHEQQAAEKKTRKYVQED